jgi:DNA polymerase-3 subunit alpha
LNRNEDLKEILKDTYGIPIFQEQIMSILQKLLNYSEEESDSVRSAISDKNPIVLSELKSKLYAVLPTKDWNNLQIEEVYQTILEDLKC